MNIAKKAFNYDCISRGTRPPVSTLMTWRCDDAQSAHMKEIQTSSKKKTTLTLTQSGYDSSSESTVYKLFILPNLQSLGLLYSFGSGRSSGRSSFQLFACALAQAMRQNFNKTYFDRTRRLHRLELSTRLHVPNSALTPVPHDRPNKQKVGGDRAPLTSFMCGILKSSTTRSRRICAADRVESETVGGTKRRILKKIKLQKADRNQTVPNGSNTTASSDAKIPQLAGQAKSTYRKSYDGPHPRAPLQKTILPPVGGVTVGAHPRPRPVAVNERKGAQAGVLRREARLQAAQHGPPGQHLAQPRQREAAALRGVGCPGDGDRDSRGGGGAQREGHPEARGVHQAQPAGETHLRLHHLQRVRQLSEGGG
jgi:hypothetical protein